jgi:hypothetical protein
VEVEERAMFMDSHLPHYQAANAKPRGLVMKPSALLAPGDPSGNNYLYLSWQEPGNAVAYVSVLQEASRPWFTMPVALGADADFTDNEGVTFMLGGSDAYVEADYFGRGHARLIEIYGRY